MRHPVVRNYSLLPLRAWAFAADPRRGENLAPNFETVNLDDGRAVILFHPSGNVPIVDDVPRETGKPRAGYDSPLVHVDDPEDRLEAPFPSIANLGIDRNIDAQKTKARCMHRLRVEAGAAIGGTSRRCLEPTAQRRAGPTPLVHVEPGSAGESRAVSVLSSESIASRALNAHL